MSGPLVDVALAALQESGAAWPQLNRDQRDGLTHTLHGLFADLVALGILTPERIAEALKERRSA